MPYVIFLFLAAATSGWSEPAVVSDSSCARSGDGFEEGFRFSPATTVNAGLCLDTKNYRAIRNLRIDGLRAEFENYLHDQVFWKATVSLAQADLEKVYFHIERFATVPGVTAAHTEIRFVFRNGGGVRLERPNESRVHDDLLVSFEGGRPPGVDYNFAMGTFNVYNLVPRIMSAEQKLSGSSEQFEQYELLLGPRERIELLTRALTRSQDLGLTTFYNTLRPNCTTEAFDLLDSLSTLAGKAPPFLTMISPDPVATPSLNALKRRKILGPRVQNFNDEIKGVFKSLPIPQPQKPLNSIFPDVRGKPWTLVLVAPVENEVSLAARTALAALRSELALALPKLLQAYGSALLLTDQRHRAGELLARSLSIGLSQLPGVVRRVDASLPEGERIQAHIYFAPHEGTSQGTNLESMGIPAALPFAVRDYRVSRADKRSQEIFFKVGAGVQAAARAGAPGANQAFLAGAGITIQLERGRSRVITQVAAGLEPGEHALSMVNDQVDIDRLTVPVGKRDWGRTMAVITHAQNVADDSVSPDVTVNFGPWGGLAGEIGEFGHGTYQVMEPEVSCRSRVDASPVVSGRFARHATGKDGADLLLMGKPVRFHILRARTDLVTREVHHMQVRVSTLGMECLKIDQVERQFGDEMTDMIRASVNRLGIEDLWQKVSPLL